MSAAVTALARTTPLARRPAPVWSLDGPRLVLRGSLAGRLARAPALAGFLERCRRFEHLRSVRFDLEAARLELTFDSAQVAAAQALRGWARAARETHADDGPGDAAALARRVWEAPLTLWRSGDILSTWRVHRTADGQAHLRHPLLADPAVAEVVARHLGRIPSVRKVGRRRGATLALVCDPATPDSLREVVAAAEAIETALAERLRDRAVVVAGNPLLLNTNLVLAAGAAAFPVLLPASALVLLGASWPVLRQAWLSLRQQKLDMTTVLSALSVLALVNGDHLPAAAMLWLFRFWEKRTAARLRQAETALFEQLALRAGASLPSLQGAAAAAAQVFAEPPGAAEAQAFGDASAPYMLCLGAAALFPGGPAVAQAVLRPDFFSPVLVHDRLAAATLVLRLAGLGCIVRDARALQALRDADALVLDDSVPWERDGLEPGEFARALAALGLHDLIYFRAEAAGSAHDRAASIGAERILTRSPAQTRVSYITQRRFLGHRIAYAGAIGTLAGRADADPVIAVGADFLAEDRTAPMGLLRPSLATLLEAIRLLRAAESAERTVKIATVATNTALVAGAAWLGLTTTAVVAAGTVATACVWAGSRVAAPRAEGHALPAP